MNLVSRAAPKCYRPMNLNESLEFNPGERYLMHSLSLGGIVRWKSIFESFAQRRIVSHSDERRARRSVSAPCQVAAVIPKNSHERIGITGLSDHDAFASIETASTAMKVSIAMP